MPWFDGTGPGNSGPMTGRGFGPCGRGFAFRGGFGRGFRRFGNSAYSESLTLSKEEQRKILEAELGQIELEKKELENRLKEMK